MIDREPRPEESVSDPVRECPAGQGQNRSREINEVLRASHFAEGNLPQLSKWGACAAPVPWRNLFQCACRLRLLINLVNRVDNEVRLIERDVFRALVGEYLLGIGG